MPRSKSRKPRNAARSTVSETHRRQGPRKGPPKEANAGLNRHARTNLRPLKFPGRLGGR